MKKQCTNDETKKYYCAVKYSGSLRGSTQQLHHQNRQYHYGHSKEANGEMHKTDGATPSTLSGFKMHLGHWEVLYRVVKRQIKSFEDTFEDMRQMMI